ncbi:MAG: hypothetical protein HY367_04640 [Candidatus Aenigmarchaeota archaeon]|nr:hypothetical protein [Candidatus Aenigmarchaeota archaeon]
MEKISLLMAVLIASMALAPGALAHPDIQGSPVGPPGGAFYAFDQVYRSAVTPAHVPDNGNFDTLYMFPDCQACVPVSDAAPGMPDYNGGRWAVVLAYGITTQPTNAEDVVASATSLVDTGHRFVCPVIKIN